MNLKDLKSLKNQLELQQKYIAIKNITPEEILNATDAKPLSEYVSQENTEDFVKQCEALIENYMRILAENNIPFDTIRIYSTIGFLCKENFIKNTKSILESKNLDYTTIVEQLKTQASSIFVPLSFNLNAAGTGTEDMDIDSYADEHGFNLGDIYKPRVTGIVNLETFISKMKNLGYNIELLNYGECQSSSDYIQAVIENECDTEIDIVATLTEQNDLQKDTNYGRR